MRHVGFDEDGDMSDGSCLEYQSLAGSRARSSDFLDSMYAEVSRTWLVG